jgi:molybdenum cofactor biosynthesis enzyme MoaA
MAAPSPNRVTVSMDAVDPKTFIRLASLNDHCQWLSSRFRCLMPPDETL